jgi:hypothetical protein
LRRAATQAHHKSRESEPDDGDEKKEHVGLMASSPLGMSRQRFPPVIGLPLQIL